MPVAAAKPTIPQDRAKFFYTGAAVLMLVLTVLGFRLFYQGGQAFPGRPLTPPIRTIVITHGIAMSAWIILLIIQPLLIVNNKYKVHMTLGKFGAVLAACIVFFGYRVAVGAASVNPPDMKLWGLVPKHFLAIPLMAIVLFGGFVAVGVWKRQRPEIHKPMMFFATLTAVAAAIDRIPFITQLYTGTTLGAMFGPFLAPAVIGLALLLLKWGLTRSLDRTFALCLVALAVCGGAP
jgi:hypothetical protein